MYQSDQKPKQECGVTDSQIRAYDRTKREAGESIVHRGEERSSNVTRDRRDVRYVPKFIEAALVLDKAMVSWILKFLMSPSYRDSLTRWMLV